MHALRMALIVPAAIAGWIGGVVVALLGHQFIQKLCPDEHMVSGTCVAPWSSFADDAALALGSVVCGALTVLLPTLLAPSHHARVAVSAYVSGLACSAYWLVHGQWVPVAWAALAGALTLWRIHAMLARRSARAPSYSL